MTNSRSPSTPPTTHTSRCATYHHSHFSIMLEKVPKKRKLNKLQSILEDNIHIAQEAKLWFEDGNVILVADNHPFRVHKGLLATKSAVFSSMFAVPQPQTLDENESFQGISLVPLSDKWQDVQALLKGMYYAEE